MVTGDNVFETNLTPPQVRFDDDGLRVATLPTLLDSLERLADLGGRGLPSHGPELADVSVMPGVHTPLIDARRSA